jgi:hypothetical protein
MSATDLQRYGVQLLTHAADRLAKGIMTGPDHSNSDEELARLQGARLLRECSAEIKALRGQRGAMAALMRELLQVVQTISEPESDDEARLLHEMESKATAMLAEIDQQAANAMVRA